MALQSIYGIDIQADNVQESQQRMYIMFLEKFGEVSCEVWDILKRNIVCADSLKLMSFMNGDDENETIEEGWEKAKRLYKESLEPNVEQQISLF